MNIEKIRQETPNCQDKIFLNSAGSSLTPQHIVAKVKEYLDEEEKIGGYKLADLRVAEIEQFYEAIAKLIGCQAHNIAFAHDATDAYIKALSSIRFQPNDVIITSNDDYASSQIQYLSLQQRYHIQIVRINNLENGDLDVEHFKELVAKHRPKLVTLAHIPTNSGLIQNVRAIGEICAKENILFLLDACQSVGQLALDVKKIKCDFLSATGRKFLRGPRGTGFLYVSDKVLKGGYAPLFIDGYGATWTGIKDFKMEASAKRFQTWEASYALVIGLKEAAKYANAIGMQNIQDYNEKLMHRLRTNLSSVKGIRMYDKGSKTGNLLTFRKAGKSLEDTKNYLDQHTVFYSVSTVEWGVIDFGIKGVDWVIRFSPHYFNTIEEMDKVSEILERL